MNLCIFSQSLRETHFSTGRAGSSLRAFVLRDCNQVQARRVRSRPYKCQASPTGIAQSSSGRLPYFVAIASWHEAARAVTLSLTTTALLRLREDQAEAKKGP